MTMKEVKELLEWESEREKKRCSEKVEVLELVGEIVRENIRLGGKLKKEVEEFKKGETK